MDWAQTDFKKWDHCENIDTLEKELIGGFEAYCG